MKKYPTQKRHAQIFVGGFLLVLFVSSSVVAEENPAAKVKNYQSGMQVQQDKLHRDSERAKELMRLDVFSCLDQKLKLVIGMVGVASRSAKKFDLANRKKRPAEAQKHFDRIAFIADRVNKLWELAEKCWVDPKKNTANEVAIFLKVPYAQDISTQENSSALGENFGFPQIPPASPFR